jgi:hypothetical protein
MEARIVLFKSWLTLEPNHEMITAAALPFLKTTVLRQISIQHAVEELVSFFNSAAHFDNCNFYQASSRINQLYQDAVRAADPSHFNSAAVARYFGKLLHPVQDFYSHSNWVDLGQTTILEPNLGPWDPLQPYTIHDGAMLVQGHDQEPFGPGSLERDGFVVTVHANGQDYKGVITGTWGFVNECPANVAVPHGSIFSPNGLNKDGPHVYNGGLYPTAAELAIEQTSHEFERLVGMVEDAYGTAQPLLDAWLNSDDAGQQFLTTAGSDPVATQAFAHALTRQSLPLDQTVPAFNQTEFPQLLEQELQETYGRAVPPELLAFLTSGDPSLFDHGGPHLGILAFEAWANAPQGGAYAQIAASFSSLTAGDLSSFALLYGHSAHSPTDSINVPVGAFSAMMFGHAVTPDIMLAISHSSAAAVHDYLVNQPYQGVDHKPG